MDKSAAIFPFWYFIIALAIQALLATFLAILLSIIFFVPELVLNLEFSNSTIFAVVINILSTIIVIISVYYGTLYLLNRTHYPKIRLTAIYASFVIIHGYLILFIIESLTIGIAPSTTSPPPTILEHLFNIILIATGSICGYLHHQYLSKIKK